MTNITNETARNGKAPSSKRLRPPIYHGIFVERDDIDDVRDDLIPNGYDYGELDRVVMLTHVTFGYKTVPVEGFPYGRETNIRVVGYGNDGLSEGLEVELPVFSLRFYKGAVPAHVTLSYAPNVSAARTAELEFTPIDKKDGNVILKGRFGWFDGRHVRFDEWHA